MSRLSEGRRLEDLFMDAYWEICRLNWRIYGNRSHKLLCRDYGSMTEDTFDDLEVVSTKIDKAKGRLIVYVKEVA